jgi:hypothetical protein
MSNVFAKANPLLVAVGRDDFDLVERLVRSGSNLFEKSGYKGYTALMGAIIKENCDMINLVLELGERINRVQNGSDAIDFAIDNQRWSALAHLIRLKGYPKNKYGDLTHLEIAKGLKYYEGVSILQHELDTPGFWRHPENLRYGQVHMDMVKEFALEDNITRTPEEQYQYNKKEYESFAPSRQYLSETGWYDRSDADQRAAVDSEHTRLFMADMRRKRFNRRERSNP